MELAIVIPAYKERFLNATLRSLSNQTNKNFNVYIGDDCSPYNLKSIIDSFKQELNISYTRFHNNIGAENLVNQWKRCVDLIQDEKWIWLFSDDDIADPNCVEVFYKTIKSDNSRFDVYRFNTRVINDKGELRGESIESPFVDSSENMAYEILMGRRGNSMPDHIFSKEVYATNNGFVYTDFAQAADWATSILFSAQKGICTMRAAKVNWRIGSSNISGQASKEKYKMIKGHIQFLKWLIQHFQNIEVHKNNLISYNQIISAAEYNLRFVIRTHYKGLSFLNYFDILSYYALKEKDFKSSLKKTLQLYYDCKVGRYLSKFRSVSMKLKKIIPRQRRSIKQS